MLRACVAGLETASRGRVTVAAAALGAIAFVAAGCHSSSHGVAGTGGAGGNAHGDAAGDVAGGGGSAATTDGGADARGSGGASGDAAVGGSGGSGAGDAASDAYGAACNTLTTGASVTIVCAPDGGMPAAPTGGTIVPGTYVLSAITEYGGCTPAAIAQTVVLTENTVETVADSTITGPSRVNATYVVSGASFVQTGTCPTTDMNTYPFSVTTAAGVTTMTLLSSSGTTTIVAVYTKQ